MDETILKTGIAASAFAMGLLTLTLAPDPPGHDTQTPMGAKVLSLILAGVLILLTIVEARFGLLPLINKGGATEWVATASALSLLAFASIAVLAFPLTLHVLALKWLLQLPFLGAGSHIRETPAWWLSVALALWASLVLLYLGILGTPQVFIFGTGTGAILAFISWDLQRPAPGRLSRRG